MHIFGSFTDVPFRTFYNHQKPFWPFSSFGKLDDDQHILHAPWNFISWLTVYEFAVNAAMLIWWSVSASYMKNSKWPWDHEFLKQTRQEARNIENNFVLSIYIQCLSSENKHYRKKGKVFLQYSKDTKGAQFLYWSRTKRKLKESTV